MHPHTFGVMFVLSTYYLQLGLHIQKGVYVQVPLCIVQHKGTSKVWRWSSLGVVWMSYLWSRMHQSSLLFSDPAEFVAPGGEKNQVKNVRVQVWSYYYEYKKIVTLVVIKSRASLQLTPDYYSQRTVSLKTSGLTEATVSYKVSLF